MGKPSKYQTHVQPYLDKIADWVSKGAAQDEIAKNLHITKSTLALYLKKGRDGEKPYSDLSDAFAQACEVPDDNVEAALYKRACGYTWVEEIEEEKLDRNGNIVLLKRKRTVDVPPDPTSAMFWLANRRKDKWKYKPADEPESRDSETGVVLMPEIKEAANGK